MLKENRMVMMKWISILALSLGVDFVVWLILKLIFPSDSLQVLSLEKSETYFDIKRLAFGLLFFSMLYLVFALQSDSRRNDKGSNKIFNPDSMNNFLNNVRAVFLLVFISYFFMFWTTYIAYAWFIRISRIIGNYGIELWTGFLCIALLNITAIYLFLSEPWKELLKDKVRPNVMQQTMIRIIMYAFLCCIMYFLGTLNFLFDLPAIMAITITLLIIVLVFWKKTIKRQNSPN